VAIGRRGLGMHSCLCLTVSCRGEMITLRAILSYALVRCSQRHSCTALSLRREFRKHIRLCAELCACGSHALEMINAIRYKMSTYMALDYLFLGERPMLRLLFGNSLYFCIPNLCRFAHL
jgi:hypothetical protein